MLESIVGQFAVTGTLLAVGRFGSGLINDTYLCDVGEYGAVRRYVLQRINAAVFNRPEEVMENVERVTAHIAARLRAQGVAEPSAVAPVLVRAKDGRPFVRDAGGAFWRLFPFIEAGAVRDRVLDADHAYEVGRGLGAFQALLSDLSPAALHDTLPGFHFTPKYLDEYDRALREDAYERAASVLAEREIIYRRRSLAPSLTDRIAAGGLPIRVVHNDPKVNNVMVHAVTGKALCMLDLDTVKPGIVHFDFGDCVRSAANPAGEDADGDVAIDLSLFEALTEGYFSEARSFLTGGETALLALSVKVITFELGLRFLTDYLRGDAYFRTAYPGHNLHRARVQFRLLESIERAESWMHAFIMRLCCDAGPPVIS